MLIKIACNTTSAHNMVYMLETPWIWALETTLYVSKCTRFTCLRCICYCWPCFTGCFKLFLFFLVYKCYMVAILFFMIRFIDVCLQRLCVLRDPLGTARKLHLLILGKIVHRFLTVMTVMIWLFLLFFISHFLSGAVVALMLCLCVALLHTCVVWGVQIRVSFAEILHEQDLCSH